MTGVRSNRARRHITFRPPRFFIRSLITSGSVRASITAGTPSPAAFKARSSAGRTSAWSVIRSPCPPTASARRS